MHRLGLLLLLVVMIELGSSMPKSIDLPEVVLEKAPEIEAPPPDTADTDDPADKELEGPLILNDLPSDLMKLQAAFDWLSRYGYYTGDTSQVDRENEIELAKFIIEPLKKMEKNYNLAVDGILDEDVLNEMTPERCGEHDKVGEPKREKRWARLGSVIWSDLPVLMKFRDYGSRMSQHDQKEALKHCARLWGRNSGLSFKMASHYENANIEIIFKYIDGAWNTIGTGQSPVPYRNPATSMLTLDSSERFKMSKNDPEQGVSLKWSICHEMGHTLGLSHSHDRDAIMYPSGTGQDEEELSYDDRTGIQALYGPPNGKDLLGDDHYDRDHDHYDDRDNDDYDDDRNNLIDELDHFGTPLHNTNDRYDINTYRNRYDKRYRRPSPPSPQPRPPPRRPSPPPPPPRRPQTYWPQRTSRTPNYAPAGYRPNYRPSYIPSNFLPW